MRVRTRHGFDERVLIRRIREAQALQIAEILAGRLRDHDDRDVRAAGKRRGLVDLLLGVRAKRRLLIAVAGERDLCGRGERADRRNDRHVDLEPRIAPPAAARRRPEGEAAAARERAGDRIARIARTAAGQHGRIGMAADHRDARQCGSRKRQLVAVVLQQHDRLLGDALREPVRGREIDGAAALGRIVHHADADHHGELAAHHVVEACGRHRAVRNCLLDGGRRQVDGRADVLFLVEPRVDRGRGAVRRPPVGLHLALEAPFVLQHVVEQVIVLAGIRAVQAVVAAHHAAGLPALRGDLERQQVELAQRAFVDLAVAAHPAMFLLVARVVLDGRDDLLPLRAERAFGEQIAGKQRILAEILEQPAAARLAREVGAAAQTHAEPLRAQLDRDLPAVVVRQPAIPARGHRDRRGEGRAGERRAAGAGRRVGHVQVGNAEPRHTLDIAGTAARHLRHFVLRMDELKFLVERHLAHEQVGAPLRGGRRERVGGVAR